MTAREKRGFLVGWFSKKRMITIIIIVIIPFCITTNTTPTGIGTITSITPRDIMYVQ